MRFQISNRGEHIVLKRSTIEIRLPRTAGATESAKVDRHDSESGGFKPARLIAPALLTKPPAMSQHHPAIALAIEVGTDVSAILSRNRDRFLRADDRGQQQDAKRRHAKNYTAPRL